MLQLANISNYVTDNELFGNNSQQLHAFLSRHNLDGLEMMFCAPWDAQFHKPEWMQGCHLRFWPWWLDFWRGDQEALLRLFGSQGNINECYGGSTREAWLEIYRENIRAASKAGVKYLVLHVSHARTAELFSWKFSATSREVIEATIEVVNELTPAIPQDVTLLFENLWWPGLTLTDKGLTAMLLDSVDHRNIGIMLDTGHLMNTNPDLRTEAAGAEYVINTLESLGSYAQYVKGIHLHKSLSGKYLKASQTSSKHNTAYNMDEVMNHVLKIDEHRPFTTSAARSIVDYLQPEFLVHEFMYKDLAEWEQKLDQQQRALGLKEKAI